MSYPLCASMQHSAASTESALDVPRSPDIMTCALPVVCPLPYILITVLLSGAILRAQQFS